MRRTLDARKRLSDGSEGGGREVPIGPFDVTSEQISQVGTAFTTFVNGLLAREVAAVDLAGHLLRVDSQDETADGGVDAQLTAGPGTRWIPSGQSAWQFKRGDLAPAKCKEELEGAAWARELIAAGSAYRLVLGARLTPAKVDRRRDALLEKAADLGLTDLADDQIEVLDANSLAAWASSYPSLATSRLLGRLGHSITDFSQWASSRHHQSTWQPDDARNGLIDQIRADLVTPDRQPVRVQGVSGSGKTRLVMEAVRTQIWQALVAYVEDSALTAELLNELVAEGRSTILVADECDARRHEKLCEALPVDADLRLITIGEGNYPTRTATIQLPPLSDPEMDALLSADYPQLWPEARRFITDNGNGNPRWAIVVAERLKRSEPAAAAELIARGDIEYFTSSLLVGDESFFGAAILALFERVGWDRELRTQLDSIAGFDGVTIGALEAASAALEANGLVERRGRYRAVVPQPLAVILAAEAWRRYGERLVSELLPRLDRDLALSFFARTADLGSFGPARETLRGLMAPEGPFGSLASMDEHDLGSFLVQLAVVAPDETLQHLQRLIESSTDAELERCVRLRRGLVWALEKLAWHRRTFEGSADLLLRLAVAENEAYANNATGVWGALFGAALPTTAANPEDRLRYLEERIEDDKVAVRGIIARALGGLLHPHEWVTVSGELQGGVLVEPRGSVTTEEEAGQYRAGLIRHLSKLSRDPDDGVQRDAAKGLVAAINPLADDPICGPILAEALGLLQRDALEDARLEIQRLLRLFDEDEYRFRQAGIHRLAESLPEPTEVEKLRTTLGLDPWEFERSGDLADLTRLLTAAVTDDELADWLERPWPLSWHLGRAVAALSLGPSRLDALLDRVAIANVAVAAGVLSSRIDEGDEGAFDQYIDPRLAALPPEVALALTVRGPATPAARRRVVSLVQALPSRLAAPVSFSWVRNIDVADFEAITGAWASTIAEQIDYNAAIDWISLWFHGHRDAEISSIDTVLELLGFRTRFPAMGNERWDWCQIATYCLATAPESVIDLVLSAADSDVYLHAGDLEGELLSQAAKVAPKTLWDRVAARLVAGDWRIQMSIRGWLIDHIPVKVISDWVDGSLERARLVASIARVGGSSPTPVAFYLFENFGSDEAIASSLAAEFSSGSWVGPWSGRLSSQLEQLNGWLASDLPPSAKAWATRMIDSLTRERTAAVEREQEERRR